MKKFLFLFVLIFLVFFNTLKAENIEEIEIIGNKRVAKETIIVLGDVNKSISFSSDEFNKTLKKLYQTGFFSDVSLFFNKGLLKIKVVENPIIENIEITGIKKKNHLWK